MKKIKVKNKQDYLEMLIDDEDYEFISSISWSLNGGGYPAGWVNGKTVKAHRIIFPSKKGFVTDHINGNKLDNRASNLRHATQRQNSQNRSSLKRVCSSKFKGVCWHKNNKKWVAHITSSEGARVHLGSFEDELLAARAYNDAARKMYGEFAKLNLIS